MSSAFPRPLRLISQAEFDRVFQQSSKSYSAWFILLYRANHLGYPRLGFAISKKRIKKAVSRNQIKRIVRESFRLKQQQLGSWDIVVLARPQIRSSQTSKASKTEQRQAIEQHWQDLLHQH